MGDERVEGVEGRRGIVELKSLKPRGLELTVSVL